MGAGGAFGPDSPTSPGSTYYSSASTWMLRRVLDKARTGRLSPQWREEETATLNPPPGQALSDAHRILIQEIAELEPAPWEPGRAATWREALNAWFVASLLIEATQFANSMNLTVRQVASFTRMLPTQVRTLQPADIRIPAPAGDTNAWSFIAGEHQHSLDNAVRDTGSGYICARDWLSASYLAGLAAGGTPGPDWRDWLTARSEQWVDCPDAVQRVKAELMSPAGTHTLENLPQYWLPK